MSLQQKHSKITLSQQGFALITAILACVILFALAMLVIYLSTSDLRVSGRTVGEKKAMSAAEAAIGHLLDNFDVGNPAASATAGWQKVDASNDPASEFSIGTPADPTTGPEGVTLPGYEWPWGQKVFVVTVAGRNTTYNTEIQIDTGFGYGPVDLSPWYR